MLNLLDAIDYNKTHAEAMKLLDDAGIRVIIVGIPRRLSSISISLTMKQIHQTLSTVTHYINRMDPYSSYNAKNLTGFLRTVDAIASFPNVLGVLVSEHLINNLDSEKCALVIRAVVRDLKKYMHLRHLSCGQRTLLIGFGGGSYLYDRKVLDYLSGGDEDSCVDFWTVFICLEDVGCAIG